MISLSKAPCCERHATLVASHQGRLSLRCFLSSEIAVASLPQLSRYLTMQCMADVILESATPDDEALKSPRQQRWCEGEGQTTVAFDGETSRVLHRPIRNGVICLSTDVQPYTVTSVSFDVFDHFV